MISSAEMTHCEVILWTRELPGVALGNISNGQIFTGKSKPGQINLKLMRVTPEGLEGFEELSTAYKFVVSEALSRKTSKPKTPI